MTVTYSQDIRNTTLITPASGGAPSRSLKPLQDALDKPTSQQPSGKGITIAGDAVALLDANFESATADEKTSYDEPDGRTQRALEAYQSLAGQQKREALQQLLSVDLYA